MQIPECIQLIERGFPKKIDKLIWADLGCGNGLFTKALASLLGKKSKIFALDKTHQIIEPIYHYSEIEFIKTDFVGEPLTLKNLDGVLMANSLHYVKDKPKLILEI
ncbi:MAG TPA: hypothetical protein DGG95_18515, partial [Cytophagales bacterium]|nr:hypothetical protein [Cytophagales bacterium]